MTIRRFQVDVTTAADGTATAYSPWLTGYLHQIHYVKDGTTPYDNGVDFTITSEATGQSIWTQSDVNASAVSVPRQPTNTQAGVASLYAASGTAVNDRIAVGRDRVKIVLAQGGNAKTGRFLVLVDDGR